MNFYSSLPFVRLVNASSHSDIKATNNNFLLFTFCKARYAPPILAIVLILISSLSAFGQVTEEWVANYNGTGNGFEYMIEMLSDTEGNVYVTGYSTGDGTGRDYATVKYNAAGEELWTARFNGPANRDDLVSGMAIDGEGNVYVTGEVVKNSFDEDYATVKYNAAGEEQWVAYYNGYGEGNDMEDSIDRASSIGVDGDGNVYVTGFSSRKDDGLPEYVTVKYNAAGEEQWVARYSGSADRVYDMPRAMIVDAEGNSYVTGSSNGNGTKSDYATVKYNAAGEEQWVARYNGPTNESDTPRYIDFDVEGNVYVTGISEGKDSEYDYATVKYNSLGQEQWAVRYDEPGNGHDLANYLIVDVEGNVYVTGSGGYMEDADYATVKYNANGLTQWVARYNGPGNGRDEAHALALDEEGNIYVTGRSLGNGTNLDFATIKYNPRGEKEWLIRFDSPMNGGDRAIAITLDPEENIYVAGDSQNSGGKSLFTTIKYRQHSNPADLIAPSELSAEGVSPSQINLSWRDNTTDEDKFVLERAVNPDFTGSVAYINIPANSTSYEDPYKTTDVTFYYRIKAVRGDVSSDYSSTVSAIATETASNQPPVVDAGEDKTISLPADSVSFTAAASDPDGEIVSYLWEQLEGPSVTLNGENTNTLLVTELEEGSYTFEVTVTDDKGDTASDGVKLTVNPESEENIPPVAHAGEDQTVTAGSDGTASVTLNGSASSDPDGSINRYEWSRDGEEFMKGVNPTVSLPVGIHTITLTVYDNEWVTDTDEVEITVNAAPDFATPSNLTARSVSDSQINLSWQEYGAEEDGFVLERATNAHFTGSVAYIQLPAGRTSYEDGNKSKDVTFYYRLKAVKGDDASPYSNIATATAGSTPEQTGPVAHAGEDQAVKAGEDGKASVTLDGSASTASEGSIADYRWTLAGEEIATGINPTVSLGVGTHSITLTVTDGEGATDSDEVTITVQEANASFAAPSDLTAVGVSGTQINLSWQDNTQDEEGFILERATNPDFTGSVAYINISANSTSYEDGNKTTGVTFYYRVKAVKGSISSDYSNIASAAASNTAGTSMRVAGSADTDVEGFTQAELQVHPNPLQQEFTLKLHNDYEGPVRLMLFDMTGRMFMEESFEKTSANHTEKLRLSGLSLTKGVYFLKVIGEGMDEKMIRLIKE